jgi:predicted  nucleic acid-binding Zn-ribbon protein
MGEPPKLSADAVEAISLERALQDAEAANARVIALTKGILDREEKIAQLERELVSIKRTMDTRRRIESVVRRNHILYALASRAKRMTGK